MRAKIRHKVSKTVFTIIDLFLIFLTLMSLISSFNTIITDNLSFVKRLLGLRGRIRLVGWCMDVVFHSDGLLYLFEF